MQHVRTAPKHHAFSYRMAMFYLDLDEIEHLNVAPRLLTSRKFSLYRFCRTDYHRPNCPDLKQAVLETFGKLTGYVLQGDERVCLLTQLRTLGYCYNPVSFYYIFRSASSQWLGVLAEINNTPWNERHSYALLSSDGQNAEKIFQKIFHVSPFMPMDQQYAWQFGPPKQNVTVHMENFDPQYGKCFVAQLKLSLKKISPLNVLSVFFCYPLTTFITISAIYWHALRLRIKGVKYLEHPQPLESRHAR